MEIELQSLPGLLYLLLFAATLVQLAYYLFIYRKLFSYREGEDGEAPMQPVSVIVAARNEAGNLESYLPAILTQDYPDFEVIVVNDRSYDGTAELLKELKEQYPGLRVVDIPENDKYRQGKKFALTMGVKAAAHELLLFTDADCRPLSPFWIKNMQRGYAHAGTEIVLGASPYEKRKGLLNAFIRYETFYTAINYLSFALAGMPYMGVGRNLSYKKSLFFKQKGFASHLHLRSGDDDLFVNRAADSGNTRIAFSRESQTVSKAELTWGDYIRQKRRHQSVGKYYRGKHKFFLSLHACAAILFYACLFTLSGIAWDPVFLGVAAGSKWLVQYIVFRPVMKRMKAGDLWLFLPFLDLLYHIYILIMNLTPTSPENVQWK
ncbi:glycosyltransferase [Anseongella ginsenosidimutans]|uniref:glycosyltransferase n=1 Tax=Anseongella ginsenosidimutans TaxID=496056 RepID=UPI001049D7CA|nr:glycosyltransferase [Anseongella ginsenosidimutans]